MARIAYEKKKFAPATLQVIDAAIDILHEYDADGYDITLRQLFYQFVSRGLIPNKQTEYKRLGSIINDARMAGYIDWDLLVDRTRSLRRMSEWDSPADLIETATDQYRRKVWETQDTYVEVWIEKDALVGVIERPCNKWSVPYFSCRGYVSQSEMWGASQRLGRRLADDKKVLIIHLGDHDPSGVDMTRDINDRLRWFLMCDRFRHADHRGSTPSEVTGYIDDHFEVRRVALTMDQIRQYSPPPNPAKFTDSRARDYVAQYGHESWELDALDPADMAELIEEHIQSAIEPDAWNAAKAREKSEKSTLTSISDRWSDVEAFIENDEEN